MGIKARGMNKVRRNIHLMINDVAGRRAVRAIYAALDVGAIAASLYTPIDTSTLINSQYREVVASGNRITGRIGYSANYAIYVQDPNIPQTFRRSTAKKEFLQKGIEDAKPQMLDAIARELSRR
ncbi:hypothetical protein D3C75_619020 [compost metagenome]